MAELCVNIDHVATLRQARRGKVPDPVEAAKAVERAGAAGITVHLREDRRHINDDDVIRLRKSVSTKFNLEMALSDSVIRTALKTRPDEATIVPEKRKELTTEGGLDVIKSMVKLKRTIPLLKKMGTVVSLFIDADPEQIKAAKDAGADLIELHTGKYADAKTAAVRARELKKIRAGAALALKYGLKVNAGHGLDYDNTKAIAAIEGITDLNTGHSIISRAVLTGLERAVRDMLELTGKKGKINAKRQKAG